MVDKTLFKVSFLLSFKRIFKGFNALLVSLYFIIPIIIYIKDCYETALNTQIYTTPFLFLFLAGNIINEDFKGGSLENILFVSGKYRLFLFYRPICNIIISTFIFFAYFLIFFIISLLTNNPFMPIKILPWLLCGVYWVLLASFLSYYIKGSVNSLSLFTVFLVAAISPIILQGKFLDIFSIIRNGNIEGVSQLLISVVYLLLAPIFIYHHLKHQIFLAIMIIILLIILWEKAKNTEVGS